MIFDTLPNFHSYIPVHRLFPIVSEFIHSHDLLTFSVGKHPIGHGISLIIDEYITSKPDGRYLESHRSFIDIQLMLAGTETIGICPASQCKTVQQYDVEKDYEKSSGDMDFITLRENDFAIFFPQDAHLPGTTVSGTPGRVRKMVAKIPFAPRSARV